MEVYGGMVWQRRGVGMGVLRLMRVMIISYFMNVICVGRRGVGGYRYILIFVLRCEYVTLYLMNFILFLLISYHKMCGFERCCHFLKTFSDRVHSVKKDNPLRDGHKY